VSLIVGVVVVVVAVAVVVVVVVVVVAAAAFVSCIRFAFVSLYFIASAHVGSSKGVSTLF
jgi:hypothetical protein